MCRCPQCATGDGVKSCKLCEGTCVHDVCLPSASGGSGVLGVLWTVLLTLALAAALALAAYRLFLRRYMDREVRALMGQVRLRFC